MATKVLSKFKQRLASMELEPSSGGCFELTIDDNLVYSKLSTGEFPAEDAIVAEVEKRL